MAGLWIGDSTGSISFIFGQSVAPRQSLKRRLTIIGSTDRLERQYAGDAANIFRAEHQREIRL